MKYIKDMQNILIIEDDNSFSEQLAMLLLHINFNPHVEDSCKGGLSYFKQNKQDINLILLDINFDNEPCGLDVLKQIRNISPDIWIGVMSYNHDYVDQSLSLGASIPIKKGVTGVDELISLLKYSNKFDLFSKKKVELECDFEYAEEEGCFKLNSNPLILGPLQNRILNILYTKPPIDRTIGSPAHAYKQSDIQKLINQKHIVDTTNIRVNINHIRNKIDAISKGCGMKIIVTYPGYGYGCPYSPLTT